MLEILLKMQNFFPRTRFITILLAHYDDMTSEYDMLKLKLTFAL